MVVYYKIKKVAIAVKIKKRFLQIKRFLQTKKELNKSLVIKYPKSEINGLWEERVGGFTHTQTKR